MTDPVLHLFVNLIFAAPTLWLRNISSTWSDMKMQILDMGTSFAQVVHIPQKNSLFGSFVIKNFKNLVKSQTTL